MTEPRFRFAGTALATRDPQTLADFYEALLGWSRLMDEDGWVAIRPESGGTAIAFHTDEHYEPPTWPTVPGLNAVVAHLDIATDDIEGAVARALELGARLADTQPDPVERVLIDPDGHPFCVVPGSGW